jgi:hypothetical protein
VVAANHTTAVSRRVFWSVISTNRLRQSGDADLTLNHQDINEAAYENAKAFHDKCENST